MQLLLFGAPKSDWTPPEILPDLSAARYICVDCETKDPYLKTRGPGEMRRDGFICGVAISTDAGHELYLPIAHEGGGNIDRGLVKRYLKKQLSNPQQHKVFANWSYDLGWLKSDLDVDVAGKIYDVQVAEPLIDGSQRSYSLERISKHYLGEGKAEDLLDQALKAFFSPNEAHKGNLWKLHSKYVGPYAAGDTRQTLAVFMKQLDELRRLDLEEIFDLETRLIPCLFYMRRLGVPVDIPRAELAMRDLQRKEAELQAQLDHMVGLRINVWAAQSLQAAYDEKGLRYPRLQDKPDGSPGGGSFTKEWLAEQTDEVSQLVSRIRKTNKMWSTFVKGQVLEHHINGRVHCQFHALRSDEGGAVTGRFSSSGPNLQQVPSPEKDKELAKFARGLFVPELGCDWYCNDFSQVEPKIQLHYALLRGHAGADKALEGILAGEDFHTITAKLTGLPRKQAKTINLGLAYGMGVFKLSNQLGVSEAEARVILEQYHAKMPFLKGIIGEVTESADKKGFIRTLGGRVSRFNQWEPGGYGRKGQALNSRQAALEAYGSPVRRAFTHKAFNYLVQGSAADAIKRVMVDVYESGVLSDGASCHLTVHDELDFSIEKNNAKLAKRVIEIMENSVKLRVPLRVDAEIGPNWGDVQKAA